MLSNFLMKVRRKSIEKQSDQFEVFQSKMKKDPTTFFENLGLYRIFNNSENLIFAEELILGVSIASNFLTTENSFFLYDKKKKEFIERSYESFFNRGFSFQGGGENGFWAYSQKSVNLSYRSDFSLEHGYLHASINDPLLNLQLDALTNLSQKQSLKETSVFDSESGSIFSERGIGFQAQGVVNWNDKVYDFSPKSDRLFSFFSMGKTPISPMSLYFYSRGKKEESYAGYFSDYSDIRKKSENFLWTNGKTVRLGESEFNLNRSQKTCVVKNNSGIEITFIPENYLIQKKIGKFLPETKTKVIGKISCKLRLNKKIELIKDAEAILEY